MDDANLYLSGLGIPSGLPELNLAHVKKSLPCWRCPCWCPLMIVCSGRYGATTIHGSASQFSKKKDKFLQSAPTITWDSDSDKYTLLYLDPDAPDRAGDGSGAGKFGPWLHWLVTDCTKGNVNTGTQALDHMGPGPPKGNHRYIFVLFKQTGNPTVGSVARKSWDVMGFLKSNANSLTPVASNFFYCDKN